MIPMSITIPKEPTRVWELPVPIHVDESTKHAHIYLTDQIGEPMNYDELTYVLQSLTSEHVVNLYLSTPGGHMDSAIVLMDAIRSSKARTIAHIRGEVASAGTMIALACDELNVRPHSSFMIHYYSGGVVGKGNEVQIQQKFMDKAAKALFNDIYSNFLTSREINKVINGEDIWLTTDEVIERFNRVLEARNGSTV